MNNKLRVFEKVVLKKFSSMRGKVIVGWRKLHNGILKIVLARKRKVR